jgi:hypothetical protein
MRIHNLYTDSKGESHFRDLAVEWAEETRAGKLSKRLPATGIIFREVPPTYDLDWHPAPRRQYIINLDAGVQITASDGEARTIEAGEVILVEDTPAGPSLQGGRGQDPPLHLRPHRLAPRRRGPGGPVKICFFDSYSSASSRRTAWWTCRTWCATSAPGPHGLING